MSQAILAEEDRLFRDTVRSWIDAEIGKDWCRALEREEDAFPHDFWDKLCAFGAHGIGIPEEYGGQGGSIVTQVLFARELARTAAGVGWVWGVTSLCGRHRHVAKTGRTHVPRRRQAAKRRPALCKRLEHGQGAVLRVRRSRRRPRHSDPRRHGLLRRDGYAALLARRQAPAHRADQQRDGEEHDRRGPRPAAVFLSWEASMSRLVIGAFAL